MKIFYNSRTPVRILRNNHSIIEEIYKIVDVINTCSDAKNTVQLRFLDIENASDKI